MANGSATPLVDLADADRAAPAGEVVDLEGFAVRLERFAAHAAASRHVAIYRFAIPSGATAPALDAPDDLRDARDQLHMILAMTGGAIAKSADGVCVRVPITVAPRFERLARPLIEAFLVAFRRDGLDQGSGGPVR